jgi:medium-chain acyl-[acyl-carrier-protein] hydrolase
MKNFVKTFPFRKVLANPRFRMLCFPYAGGSASLYRTWPQRLGPAIDVCPVELPGRGVRILEPPINAMSTLCDHLAAMIEPLLDVPTVLFGHSMGAQIAFEIALRFDGRIAHLFASGSPAPGATSGFVRICDHGPTMQLSDGDLKQHLLELGGTPPAVLGDSELMTQILPVVRADFILIESYRPATQARLSCPITVFAGMDDARTFASATTWELRTGDRCRVVELQAGHFFLDSHRDTLFREIGCDLECRLA